MTYPVTGPKIGVVGGGQLARMMAAEAHELGIDLRVLAENPEACAVQVVPHAPVGDYTDLEQLWEFARDLDVLTFDHEHVPTDLLRSLLDRGVNVQPGPDALVYAQDKLRMRKAVQRLGLPNPDWAEVTSLHELVAFGERCGWPVVLKTPRGGYDGKGVLVLDSVDQAGSPTVRSWFDGLEERKDFSSLLVEEKVPFSRELSVLIARRSSGEMRAWPVVESVQVNSVCDEVIAPAPGLDPEVGEAVVTAAKRLASELGVTGVMAVELFETPHAEQGFLINELAMRPHNSGHWTQNGSVTSQFEQHLRAVLDLPLGGTELTNQVTVMKNFLGGENTDIFAAYPVALAASPQAKIHCYGKGVRAGRKIGHINLGGRETEAAKLRAAAARVARLLAEGHE